MHCCWRVGYVGRGCQSVPSSSKVLVIMAEQRSAFYVGEQFLTYEEFADKLTIGYCSMVSRLTCF